MAEIIPVIFTRCCDHGISDGECRKCEIAYQRRELQIKLVCIIGSLGTLGLTLIYFVAK